jgi:hypothetical protein
MARALVVLFALAATLATAPATAGRTCMGLSVDLVGTPGDDYIDVVAHGVTDVNGDGFITIATRGGNDRVYGSAADEVVCLGSGNDLFSGKIGNDRAAGGAGNDRLLGGPHQDDLRGGGGADEIRGKQGDDILRGGGGDDVIYGDEHDDQLLGGRGNDTIRGLDGADVIRGQAGDDLLFGGDGPDDIAGGAGDDTGFGNGGEDAIRGGSGNDMLHGGAGADRLLGNAGYDQLFANVSTGATDTVGTNRGGRDFDVCRGGDTQGGCETHPGPRDSQEWSPLINKVFLRWGIKGEAKVWRAVNIVDCESNGDPFVVNPSSGTTGLFQHRLVGTGGEKFWEARVARVIANHSDIEPDFPADASPFHPEHNAIVAALLLWESIPGNVTAAGHRHGVWGHWHCGEILGYWD